VWLLALMKYNLSTAVWVGLIAVAGVAAETGIVMVVYLDEAFTRYMSEGRIQKPDDVDELRARGTHRNYFEGGRYVAKFRNSAADATPSSIMREDYSEPPRVYRRPFGLGQAAKACTSAWA